MSSRFLIAVLMIAAAGVPARAEEAATVAEATKALDLATFPLMPGAEAKEGRRLAILDYTAKGDCRGAYAFQKKQLEQRGWKEAPKSSVSDQSCSGAFLKDGFTVSVSTNPSYGPAGVGMVDIRLANHGNVDVSKLPVPTGAKPLYAFDTVAAYITEATVRETTEALKALYASKGWQPYGKAGDSLFFKQNAVKLTAWPSAAAAQKGKTVIQLSTELMSADLPAPPKLVEASYADATRALTLEADMKPEDLAAFYKEALGKAGWKPTTADPVKVDFRSMLIFRNDARDIITLKMNSNSLRGTLRASLEQESAAEFEEKARRAEALSAKLKSASAEYMKRAAEKADRDRVKIAIDLPAGASKVSRSRDRVEFKLPKGRARAAVEDIYNALVKAGWKSKPPQFEQLTGTVTLDKAAGVKLVILYVDTGFAEASVMLSAFGADIEEPKGP
ncbi:hypothetical protein [Singulisphaera sp. PoT]|uniref:hypothetical protein n=1 Tax=Singulisphaera sp. PoT TaxID=3411797 RepID=UPI003BF4F25B